MTADAPEHAPGAAALRRQLAIYLASLFALGRGRIALLVLLVAIGGLTESFGIVLLVPLLGLVFTGSGAGGGEFPAGLVAPVLAQVPPDRQLALLMATFVALLVLRAVVGWQRDIRLAMLSTRLVDAWRARIVQAVVSANWRRLQDIRFSRLEFALVNDVGRLSIGSDRILRGGVALIQLAILATLAFRLSPGLAAMALVTVCLIAPLLLPIVRAAHRYGAALSRQGNQRQAILSDFLLGMKLAKAHDAEQRYADAFLDLTHAMYQRSLAYLDLQLRSQNAFQVGGGLAVAAIAWYGLARADMAPAALFAFIFLIARLVGPVQQLASAVQAVVSMLPAVGGLLEIEDRLGAGERKPDAPAPNRSGGAPAEIVLEAVRYRPAGRAEPVLRDCSARIAPGSLAVLLGPSGAGKTTLADILLGLVPPDGGAVSVDGQPLQGDAARAAFRAETAYVQQDPFLFDTSLRQNLDWTMPGASDEDLWRALELAEAAEFVRALPDGLDTRPGHRGGSLSGGERQRICLARALLRRPRVLILDEATNALDPAVEQRLAGTLMRLRGIATILMIAHRLPEGLVADQYLRIEDGVLRDLATPPRP